MSARNMFYSKGKKFSKADEKRFAYQDLSYNATEDILVAMEDKNISKKELARKLGKPVSFVTALLNGSRNITLRNLSDIAFYLDIKVKVKFEETKSLEIPVTKSTFKKPASRQ